MAASPTETGLKPGETPPNSHMGSGPFVDYDVYQEAVLSLSWLWEARLRSISSTLWQRLLSK
ncbi:hypothetical protein BP5796_12583 [Coleophoma crateriformis]|uniref:Uncharacterized protein n=1 Tax=Coleophoma crateriformis TaxID=565419 RepID=A0A3D8Q7H9_9HELO|nr:hypothetical protein BP5796_12583 [Coleophoma crateriformis]